MVTAYTGPGWENPERKKIFGGSLADVYIHDGFTVAMLIEVSSVDRQAKWRSGDLLIFSPLDPYMTPMATVEDFDGAEKYIALQRQYHPDWPTVPALPNISVPRYKRPSDAREHIREIRGVLEGREFLELHGFNVWTTAVLIYVHRQGRFIDQEAIDRAQELSAVCTDMLNTKDFR
jgi:hypothetical protein